ncbi:MAG: sigma factor-like helix-turn-helix DNA-binding protein [Eubacteriales bacterium]|nr:sigma factor-like helix-turn-helix DNA-binding protein [Eubacteriales bacterium]
MQEVKAFFQRIRRRKKTVPKIRQERERAEAMETLRQDIGRAEKILQKVEPEQLRDFLWTYYLGEGQTLAQIAEEIGYSLRQTKRIEKKALDAAERAAREVPVQE